MLAGLRTALVGLLAGVLAFSVVTAYTLYTGAFGCLVYDPRLPLARSLTPACIATRAHLAGPGRHDVVMALLCAAAAILATVTVGGLAHAGSETRVRRFARRVESIAVAGVLVVLAVHVDPAIRGLGDWLASGIVFLLSWLWAREIARAWPALTTVGVEPGVFATTPRHTLTIRLLLGVPLAVGSAAVVGHFANQHDMHHVHGGAVFLSTWVYAAGAATLVLLAQYTSLRSKWKQRPAMGAEHMGARWSAACILLLAGLLFVNATAPAGSESATSFAEAAITHLLGRTPKLTADANCATNKKYCGQRPKGPIKKARKLPHRKTHKRHVASSKPDLIVDIARVAFWLVPLAALLYFLRSRQRQMGRGGIGLLSFLQAIWQRLRRQSSRLRRILEARLPGGLVDLTASGVLARRGGRSNLSDREQIVRYYLNAMHYAQRHGLPRSPAQTPEQFEIAVHERLETGHDAWALLTADFIEARYSLRPSSDAHLTRVRSAWHSARLAIRQGMRGRARHEKETSVV